VTPTLTLAVIGHVNHGKSSLVRALTGTETDRLKEEIERGLSITLGFASRDYASGTVDLIDAPGHEDYIRAMVSGATGVRAVLLVVSATEGFGRQTLEHLRIAELLGVAAGVVVVTKADLLADSDGAAVLDVTREQLRGTFLAGEPIILCSAVTGTGLPQLDITLEALLARAPPVENLPGAFLPIDRSFSITGTGTIVTGTLLGGALTSGAEMVLQPSGHPVVIRQLQTHGRVVENAHPGGRVAVGLRGASADDIATGEVLCAPGSYRSTLQVDVEITLSPVCPRPLKHMDQVRVMWGARQDIGSLRLMGRPSIAPGERGVAQLRFAAPVIAFAGQRAVLRRPSPAETIGGAVVLDPEAAPSRGRVPQRLAVLESAAHGDLQHIATALAARDGGLISIPELARLSRQASGEAIRHLDHAFERLDDDRLVDRALMTRTRAAYLEQLSAAHLDAALKVSIAVSTIRSGLRTGASRELVAHAEKTLADSGDIRLTGAQVALPDHDPLATLPAETLARLDRIEVRLREGGLMPPDVGAMGNDGGDVADFVQLLVDTGRAVSLRNHALRQTLVFHPDALQRAADSLRTAFPVPADFTTGEARAALDTTRKFIVPVLEYLDTRGVTARQGNVRRVVEGLTTDSKEGSDKRRGS